jgi:glycosyltransferase involved in cell wall biosynthesis
MRLIRGAGVDFNRFVPRPEPIRDQVQPLRVLLAARLIWEKGIGEYVEAARILKDENRSIRFLLAGSPDKGNPAAVETRLVRGWSEEGLLEWLGHVDDMRSLLSNVDVVVLPSYYREGLPTTLVEGAACALPLITTDGPGCREVVSCNGTDGLIVPPRDARALADAIRLLDQDRALCRKLGLAAREKGLSEFDEAVVLDKMLALYQELCSFHELPQLIRPECARS